MTMSGSPPPRSAAFSSVFISPSRIPPATRPSSNRSTENWSFTTDRNSRSWQIPPALDQQLENLARYRPFGGQLPPPGDITSLDRFVRSAYFLHYLPEPQNVEEAVAGVFQLIANVSVPYGAPYSTGDVYPTWWRAAADLTNRIYYFGSTRSPNIFWLSLDDLVDDTEMRKLDPRELTLVGDQTAHLRPAMLLY